MDKPEAEKLYDSGKEPTVARLLELDNENRKTLPDKNSGWRQHSFAAG